jgi:hypothetical protein
MLDTTEYVEKLRLLDAGLKNERKVTVAKALDYVREKKILTDAWKEHLFSQHVGVPEHDLGIVWVCASSPLEDAIELSPYDVANRFDVLAFKIRTNFYPESFQK